MLLLAIIIITIAHIIRILRWEFLIETYEKPNRERLTGALSLGYFINYFIPFRIGDFFRAMYAGQKMENGRGFALATVVVERCLDVLSVGILFGIFSILKIGSSAEATIYYIGLATVLFVCLVGLYFFRKVLKKVIYNAAELLNFKYEEKLLRFFWALIWGFKDILNRLPKAKLLVYTVAMWGLYLFSYGTFSLFLKGSGISRSFNDVFVSLFDQESLLSSGIVNGFILEEETLWYALFMLAPSVLLFVLSFISGIILKNRIISSIEQKQSGNHGGEKRLNLIPQTNTGERLTFLKMYFAGEKKEYIENYLKINRNILVLRDYSAGSNATTILCTDGINTFYRKYAFVDAAKKLSDQIEWIEKYRRKLPVAEIIRKEVYEGVCFYDMPFHHDAVTLFEYIQSGDLTQAWSVIERVIDNLNNSLYCQNDKDIEDGEYETLLNDYIDSKALHNLEIICSDKSLAELLKYDSVVINGKTYDNLSSYRDLLSGANLLEIFKNDDISCIHGDLTIENIVYEKGRDAFYLIDPNTGNIFNSKFIDYAKILQSIHGKYEYLMAVKDIYVNGNKIALPNIESEAYEYLYDKYREYLHIRFSDGQIKSIYYHEVVNWLRLMPYKLKKGRGIIFFAGLIMILDDIKKL